MSKEEAALGLVGLSSGTVAAILREHGCTGKMTYARIDLAVADWLAAIAHTDVSDCENWQQVVKLLTPA